MLEHIAEDIEVDWVIPCVDVLLEEISLFLGKRNAFALYLREQGLE